MSPSNRSLWLRVCLSAVRSIGSLLPRSYGEEWTRDWLAELEAEWLDRSEAGELTAARRLGFALHVFGAAIDATRFWMEVLVASFVDLRTVIRTPWREPRTTLVVVITLALGIGATTALFSVLHGVLVRPLEYPEADRLVMIWDHPEDDPAQRTVINPLNWRDWRAQSESFEDIAAFNLTTLAVPGPDGFHRIPGTAVSTNYFDLLELDPFLGRRFVESDGDLEAGRVAIVSYGFWQKELGADTSAVGATFDTRNGELTLIGVMPREHDDPSGFFFDQPQVWVPLRGDFSEGSRSGRWLRTLARLRPGVTLEAANADMKTLSARLAEAYPEGNARWSAVVVSLQEQIVGDVRPALLVLSGAVALVLLIACANVANLMLSRSVGRSRELAMRLALGAGRSRLLGQLLAESMVLATLGGLAGVLVARWGAQAMVRLAPDLPRAQSVGLSPGVLVFALAITLLTGLLFGLAPAVKAASTELTTAMNSSGRGSEGRENRRLRDALVVGEVALSLVLLIGATLMTRSFVHLRGMDPGFDESNLLTARLDLPSSLEDQRPRAVAEVLEDLGRLPGVESVGAVSTLPIHGLNNLGLGWTVTGLREPSEGQVGAGYREATPDYFVAMGIELLSGRVFTAADRGDAPAVAIVNDVFARRFLGGENPLGKHVVSSFGGDIDAEIVGVVRGVQYLSLATPPEPEVYLPHSQHSPLSISFVAARTTGDPTALAGSLRRVVNARFPGIVVGDIAPMSDLVASSVARPRFNMLLSSLFSSVALVLATIGLYAVLAYSVSRRVHEMGIRMAFGAHANDVVRLVVGRGMRLVLAGCALGLLAAFGVTRVLRNLLHGVAVTDPGTFVAVPSLVLLVALAACCLPAVRAARLDPNAALRQD